MNLQNIEAIYPLSPFQASLLAGNLRALDPCAYCGQMICSLHGQLDSEAFERAWRLIISQHPILRTTFAWENLEKPVQLVHRQIEFSLLQHDWRGLSSEQQREMLDALVEAERDKGFHANHAPLMRLCLCRLSDDDYCLLWSYDLLVLDNWSLPLLLEKAVAVYEGQLKGKVPPVEQGRLYQDYIVWLKQQDLNQAEAFWKESLHRSNGSDNLNGLLRSTHETANGHAHIQLPSGLTASLRAFASEHDLDFQALVQGAWALLLSRYSGASEIIYGAEVSGRPADLSGASLMIGPFSNVLPVHVRVSASTPVMSWLKSLSAHLDELRRYSFYPVTNGGGSNLPAFASTVQIESAPTNGLLHENGASLHVRQMQTVAQTKAPLTLITPSQTEATLQLSYNPAAFDDASATRLTQHFEKLLTGILQQPHVPISQLSIVSAAELEQLLYTFNDAASPREYALALTLSEMFEAQAARAPEAVALSFEETTLSYRELNERANQLARYLQRQGVGPEVLVGILMDRSVEMLVAVLGILKAGGAYVPIDLSYPVERVAFMVQDSGLRLLLIQERVGELPGEYVHETLSLSEQWDAIAGESSANLPRRAQPENVAYVIYTSGSTGRPKGVLVSHENVFRLLEATQPHYDFQPSDVWTLFHSYAFDFSVWEIWGALAYGGKLVIVPYWISRSPEAFHYLLVSEQVTVLNQTPSAFRQLIAADELADEDVELQLRLIIFGGEALELQSLRPWFARHGDRTPQLVNMYGITETTVHVTYRPLSATDLELASSSVIGRPLACLQVYLLDEHGQPVPVGVPGEICVGGTGLARGYLNRAELTAERFVPHPFSTLPGARLYRSGDLARYAANGDIEYLGRIDQQVKVRGYRIELGEIEAALAEHEGVRECTVVAAAGANGETKLLAYLVARQQPAPSFTALREFLQQKLPDYMIPATFTALDAIPLTANGKVDRRALPAPDAMSLVPAADFVTPRTPVEEIVASIWSELLGVERIGVADNFFELGGHSLLATQVIARVRDAFGQEVELRSLFEQPTVAGLAQAIEIEQRAGAGLSAPPLVPVSREVELPLSFAQQRLWFLDQLEPGSSVYNIPETVRLHGVLNVEALERTLSEVVRRHEVLRTHFSAIGGEPVQVIEAAAPIKLEVLDLSALEEEVREAEVLRLGQVAVRLPFDLSRGPLLRVRLIRLCKEEHVAFVTMHHIVSDGWSKGVFIREVAALYSAYVRGEESPLEELSIQYADFAHWQRGWLQGEVLAAQVSYWREALAGIPATLELPLDRPRLREQTFNGAMVSLVMPEELRRQVQELGQRERVTLFMTLLAAFQSLLYRHSGQDDVVVGTPIANRRYRELEDIIGFFVNTVALRASSLATLTFTELLHQVREVTLGAYAHQDLPFEKLVEELQPERDLSRNPIFQVMFALQNMPGGVLELPGLTLEGQGLENRVTRFDLECHLREEGPVLNAGFVYNTDLFDQTTIERLAANYQTLLQSVVAHPSEAVASLRLMCAEDERQLLYGWNETATEYPQGLVHELFAQQVEQTPHATAVVFDDVSLTFAEVNRRGNLLASYLQSKGVGADTVVGVMLERSVEMLVAVLGVLKAGGAYLPLDPEYPAERLQFMLADAQVRVLLTQDYLADSTGTDVEILRLDTDWQTIVAEADDEDPRAAVTGDNLVYVIYTSGSTGQPKGVAMPHRVPTNLVHWQMQHSARAPRTLQFTSLSFDVSFQEIFSTWCSGGTLVLMSEATRRDASALWELLIRERIERLFLPYVALQYLAEVAEHSAEYPTTLREVTAAGEPLKITRPIRNLFAKLEGCTLDNHYGPSETHVMCALTLTGDSAAWPELPAIGRPISNTQIYLLDERLQAVPVGAAGELYIGGEVLARGYLNRAQATAEKFLPHPFELDGSVRMYRTGDQARYLADGNIEFLGRRDQQVKVRGYRIELGEVEAALRQQEQVREAVVISSTAATEEKRLIAYVLTEPGTTLTMSGLRAGLRELLPEYMMPAVFVLLEEFPLTPSGKIDRRALQARPVELETAGASVQARTPAEEILAAIWAEVLGRETIGVLDDFFELGGHSLLATQVISRVRDAFGQEMALRSLFEQPTVAGLAREIEAGRGLILQAPPLERVERPERLPLSFAQQRLWFLDQMEPGNSSYNIPAAVRLHGALNIEALERTLSEVVRRHEVLRTHFVAVDGEPVQVIEAAAPINLEVLDLSGLDEAERTAETERLVAEESARPFNLTSGPLLRVNLLRLQEDEHVALVTMHHIVSDGWSIGVLVREVAALYDAYLNGEESPLEELSIQYADFAHWQRNWLQGEVLAAQLDYWRAELADAPTVIDLPIDKPRPAVQTYRGASHPLQLSTELSAQLRDLSRRHGSTLFMTLLAAFDLLLCRYAGQEQVLVGTPIANRNRSETESLIGFFVNTLVMRGDVRGNPSFDELLRRVRETALGAYAHQDLPFEKLVEELQPERDMSRSPLFQVMFALQNAPSGALELPGLTLSSVPIGGEVAKFDLGLDLVEVDGRLLGSIEYNVDLFETATIVRLSEHFATLLQSIVANMESPVATLSLLSVAEETQLLFEWNDEPVELDPHRFIHGLFETQAGLNPQAVAVVSEHEQLTYGQLNQRANQLAHHLQSLGVGPEVVVGICVERSPEMLVALLGTLKSGAAYLPLDPAYPHERLVLMVEDAQARVLLTYEHLRPLVSGYDAEVICLDTDWETIAREPDNNPARNLLSVANQAFIIYTSGSTGKPKGVMLTHGGLVNYIQTLNDTCHLSSTDRVLQFFSISFDAFAEEVYGALTSGATLVLRTDEMLSSPHVFLRQCRELEITVLDLPTAYWHELTAGSTAEDWALERLRLVILGGEIALAQHALTWRRLAGEKVQLFNGYGPTETTIAVTGYIPPAQLDELTFASAGLPIGRPLHNLQAYVLDKHLQPVPVGVSGELHLGGAGLARGYLNNPAFTAERFIPHPFSGQAGARLYKTGDVARYLPNGDLIVTGRTDQQVKIRGFRVELGEVETALTQHPAIRECVVVAKAEATGSKRLVAYVVAEQDRVTSTGELRGYLKGNLPDYMIPSAFVTLSELPLTANNKVDRRALQALAVEVAGGESVPARTPVEEILAAIWAEVLGRATVGVHDNFFELGGHSLLATQVISRVRDAFGQEVPLRSLFEQPTVAGFAREIEAGAGLGLLAPPLERVERAERLPLSFAQQRLWFLDQMEPGNSFYNIPAAVRLHGALDIEALERTLSEVVRRHEVLRTHFVAVDGEAVQVIEPAAPIRLEVLDLGTLDEAERTAETERLVTEESARPFDLSRGSLLRVNLLRLQKDEHVALVTMHHIVSDGWSIGVLVREVAALYAAYVRGEQSPLEELAIQYADFAHWQRSWLQGEVLAAQLDYWRAELADAPTVIDLPIDKPRPPVQTHRGAYHPLALSPELSAQLRDLSRRHGSTLFMTLLAAFDLLLCRYAGQDQVLVGSPIANRNRSETEGLIGFFVNTLVLRGDVRGNPSFLELLRRVRETALGAYAHQDLPFEKLVEELQPERDMSRSPLFQVMFMLQNAPGGTLELEGLTLSEIATAGTTAKFELGLGLQELDERIVGALDYNVDLFEAATIERLVAIYERVLQAVVTDAQQLVLEIDLLSEVERQQIVQGWNETRRELRRAETIHRLFAAQAARRGEAVALVFAGEQLSYAELDRRSNQLAHHLLSLGVSPDSLVAVCLDRSPELFVALLGILKAGAAYLPLDRSYPLARLSFMRAEAGSPLLLTTEALADELPMQWTPRVLLDADWDLIALNSEEALPETVVAADQLAHVMYTSGSTGTPKGVAITHGGVVRLVTEPNYARLDQDQTLLQLAPLTFDASTLEVWGTLLNGARLVVMPPGAPTLDEISRAIVDQRVTTLWLTAGLFHLMVDEQLEDLSQVEQLLAGGDVLSVRHVEKYLAAIDGSERRLINGYGPTENTTFTCCHVMDQHTRLNGSVPIGRPITDTQVYVLDAKMQVVPVGVVGELYIGGAGLARGYFNQPELTAERFVPHPHSTEAGERLYRTGDMVRWHESGELEFIGRVDGQVKIRGFRIEVGEIEAVLAGHEDVREAVVLVREDERGDKRLAAYVVREAESEVSTGELKDYLRERMPEYMQVQWVVEVAEMPLTANGKIDRRALQALAVEIAGGESVQARTPAEEILAAIWAEVLGRETVSVHDNFFELGGHSLLATQVISRVRDAFGQEVALRSLFEQPTVAGLAREIEAGRGLGADLQAPPLMRVERAERLPLSFAQQRLWFLDQMEPGSSFYNVPAAVRLRGVLNVEALERTLSEVVRRHEVLRTCFISIDGEPVQVIEPAAPLKLEVLDLSALDDAERTAETQRLVAEESARPFDLTTGPLLRMSLIQLGAEEHVALVTMHHIVSDGWSIGVLVREVAALYSAYVRGEESPLEELPIQYADFAHWQRSWLQGEVLAAQLDYWRAELADAPTMIDLPIDKPRPPVQTFRGASQSLQLSTELSEQLRDLSRRYGSTLFMTLLAAFDLLLCRYAGQEQVLVGSPIANRNRSETEGLIGFFVNTLVLRGDVRGNPSFLELLRRVRETALGAYAHQDLPFEKLVEELQPERDMSRSPLFQVMFILQNAPSEALELEDLSLSGMESADDTVKFELTLGLEEVDDRIVGSINYNRDLYEADTIRRMVESYERVLQAVATDLEQRVFEIDLLSEAERQQILEAWNEAAAAYPRETLSELFEAQAARTPEAVALRFEDTVLSYRELNERANQLAWYLQLKGVGPDVPVGVLLERSVATIVTLLAIFKAGGAYVPLEPEYPDERLRFMARDARVALVVTQERLTNRLAGTSVIRVDADWPEIAGERHDNPPLLAGAANLAYIIYTSGSSGTPKGAMVTRGGMLNCLQWMQQRYELTAEDAFLMHTSLNFDPSVWEVFWPLLVGGRVVIAPPDMLESSAFLKYMAEQSVTCAYFVPSQLGMVVQERGLSECRFLRYVISGGEKLPLPVMQEFQRLSRAELHHSYGPTETAIAATEWTCEAGAERVLMGRPIGNTQVYVLDGQMEPLPVGVAGELYIGGAGVGRGYAGQARLTAERFVANPFSVAPGERLYRTGDLVRYDRGGQLEFVGRVDQQVKVRGYRIELGEIEAVLRRHTEVSTAVVVLHEVDGDKRLVAYVVGEAQPVELRAYLKEQLPDYMVPSFFVALSELPLLPNGKLDRRALPAPEVVAEAEYVSPRTATEEILAAIWAEVLGSQTIGVHDNFFELGGHSLLATQVISRVRDAFGQEVALRSLFEQPTLAGLAQTIEIAQRAGVGLSAPPLVPISREVELPLSFAQQRLWFLDQLEPSSSFYNIPAAVRLRGVLNVEALERTLSEVVRRHEVLRTHFVAVDGEPVQVIEPAAPVKLEVLDLSALDDAERTAEIQRLVAEESARPFDLTTGPLLRMSLIQLGAEEHVALVTMHHIVSDGWSIGVLVREVAALYSAYMRGEESPLEELPIQYADFAHWQRSWLQGEVLAAQLDYWRAELADAPTVIDLPIDKPRPPVQTFRGASHPVELSMELSAQLRDLSRNHGATLFMTLLAAFDLLLCRYAGEEQVLVGSPIANRNRSETEGLIGFFVNTLVLRGDVRGNPSFLELLRRVRETALGAYAHQDLPFEKLVEELQPERNMSRSPLFQVMFILQNAPGEALELEDLSLSEIEGAGDTVKFELSLGLEEVDDRIVGSINYNRDLYEAETIGRMVESYERVLQAVVANAEQRVFEIELLSDEERQQLIEGWNETATAYPRELTLSELFEAQAARTPESVALRFEDTVLSYHELNERANQLAWYLRGTGVGPEVLVGILMQRSVEMIVAVLGILKAGGAYVPLDPSYPLERLSFMVQDSGLRMLLTQQRLREVPGEYAHETLSLSEQWDLVAGESVEDLARSAQPESLAYVIYTSGSTGRPKGVMVQQRSVVNLATALQHSIYDEFGAGLRIGLSAPLAFDASVKQVVQLLSGHTLCILPEEARADGRQLLDYIKRYRLDSLDCTPSHLKLLGPDGVAELLALAPKLVLVGGEALEETVASQLVDSRATRFFNIYGPTECTVDATVSAVRAELPASTIGRPLPNVQVYVLDQSLRPVGIGVRGEICIAGEGVGRGYLQQPRLTAERFIPHPFSTEPGARLYRTGDVGRYLSDGNIEHLGRLDEQVKLRGFRIELGEIEAVLASHPAVREAAVLVREDKSGDKRLVAYVVAEAATGKELRDYLRARVPEYMVPFAFVLLERLPLTPNGKVDRRALPAPDALSLVLGSGFVAPRTPVEEIVTDIWSQVLGVERIGVADNFFELGGHSLWDPLESTCRHASLSIL